MLTTGSKRLRILEAIPTQAYKSSLVLAILLFHVRLCNVHVFKSSSSVMILSKRTEYPDLVFFIDTDTPWTFLKIWSNIVHDGFHLTTKCLCSREGPGTYGYVKD